MFKIDKFIFAIIISIIIAYFFPEYGGNDSALPLESIGSIGISIIFFFYGLKLGPEKLKSGLLNWKLHLLIQSTTFLIFPLIILLFKPFVQNENQEIIWVSFLFLASLPSTVSSSVVMVSIAKGNIPAAIFNASISGLIGIIVTPLWMSLAFKNFPTNFDLSTIYMGLIFEILLPVLIGICLQKVLGNWANKHNKQLTTFDQSIILLIIYRSFAQSFESKLFSNLNLNTLFYITILSICLFYLIFFITTSLSKLLKFNNQDTITAQYCGTKKSLVHGTVFSKILFPSNYPLGVIFLPIMIFHAFQIFIVSIYASKKGNK